jgi:hypothetical protein
MLRREAEVDWSKGSAGDESVAPRGGQDRVDTWTPNGESIVEHVAGVEDYQVALATYRAACERWPGTPITLRQGARVIEDSRRLRVVSSQ